MDVEQIEPFFSKQNTWNNQKVNSIESSFEMTSKIVLFVYYCFEFCFLFNFIFQV